MKILDKYLIPEWRQLHKLWSVRAALIGTALGWAMDYWPDYSEYLPAHWQPMLFTLIFVVRVVKQNGQADA